MNRLLTGLLIALLALAPAAHGMIQPEFRDGLAYSIVSPAPGSARFAGSSSVSLVLSCRNNPIDHTDPLGLADIIGTDESGRPVIVPVGDTIVDVRPNGMPLFQSDVNRMAAADRAHAAETSAAEALARAVEQCQMNLMLQAWGSGTWGQVKIAYLYGLGGMGMRNLNEAFNQQDIFANEQSTATRVLKGVGGIVETVTTTMPLARNVTTVVVKRPLTPAAAKSGQNLLPQFTGSTIDDAVASAARARSPQITEGARAIAKKLGHAESGGYTSAFQGIAPTQGNAESLIRNILSNPSRTFYGDKVIDVYNAAGQGVRIEAGSGRFMGFLEGTLATQ